MYILVGVGDPLAGPPRQQPEQGRSSSRSAPSCCNLDQPDPVRYFTGWLGAPRASSRSAAATSASRIQNQQVTALLGTAMSSTLPLVTGGHRPRDPARHLVGIISALRQYSALDYGVTFIALPVLLPARLLGRGAAEGTSAPSASTTSSRARDHRSWIIGIGADRRCLLDAAHRRRVSRRLRSSSASSCSCPPAPMLFGCPRRSGSPTRTRPGASSRRSSRPSASRWCCHRRARARRCATAGRRDSCSSSASSLLHAAAQLIDDLAADLLGWPSLAVLVGAGVGFAHGRVRPRAVHAHRRHHRRPRRGADPRSTVMQAGPRTSTTPRSRGRPIATIGAQHPEPRRRLLDPELDTFTHLLLPTLALILISFAGYTRYSRASMLEVDEPGLHPHGAGQGPARAHRRHAARVPQRADPARDHRGLRHQRAHRRRRHHRAVFAFSGMGRCSSPASAQRRSEPRDGVFLVVAHHSPSSFNLVADLVYSASTRRVRVNA